MGYPLHLQLRSVKPIQMRACSSDFSYGSGCRIFLESDMEVKSFWNLEVPGMYLTQYGGMFIEKRFLVSQFKGQIHMT